MQRFVHFDEAQASAVEAIRRWLASAAPDPGQAVLLIADLFGKLRLAVFAEAETTELSANLKQVCADWWSGEIVQVNAVDEALRNVIAASWQAAKSDASEPRFRILQRHRSRTAWFSAPLKPPWLAPTEGPPIIVFYSFKGGLGRSTSLAAFAMQRAHAGQRVCVIDFDLDSPGIGRLLSADSEGATATWGVVDYLLEHRVPSLRFDDYWHRCDRVSGNGEIRVMPAGTIDENFADKIGRVDLEEIPSAAQSGLWSLLNRTRDELQPDWILLDARTGISESSGQLLSGIAHLHVLLGSSQEQSWQGLERIIDHLGKERILVNEPQCELVLVQAMVPLGEPGRWAREAFAGRAVETFERLFYVEQTDGLDSDLYWSVADQETQDAPHVPCVIDYDPAVAAFADVSDIAESLHRGGYMEVGQRIASRFIRDDRT